MKSSRNRKRRNSLSKSFYGPIKTLTQKPHKDSINEEKYKLVSTLNINADPKQKMSKLQIMTKLRVTQE